MSAYIFEVDGVLNTSSKGIFPKPLEPENCEKEGSEESCGQEAESRFSNFSINKIGGGELGLGESGTLIIVASAGAPIYLSVIFIEDVRRSMTS